MKLLTDASSAAETRMSIRAGRWTGPTAGLAPGHVQANLVVLPEVHAADFKRFCEANPRALPLLAVTTPGSPVPETLAQDADLRVDLPKYRVYRDGRSCEEPHDIVTFWRGDFVAFLIGCSFTFDAILRAKGIPVRHVELGLNVPMYHTSRETVPVGVFSGPLVVSMRPIPRGDVDRVVRITRDLRLRVIGHQTDAFRSASPRQITPVAHGEPVHVGSPELLGISDLQRPEYGDPVPVHAGELPIFWACGVTAQAAAVHARLPLMITHAPGHMFIADLIATDVFDSDPN